MLCLLWFVAGPRIDPADAILAILARGEPEGDTVLRHKRIKGSSRLCLQCIEGPRNHFMVALPRVLLQLRQARPQGERHLERVRTPRGRQA